VAALVIFKYQLAVAQSNQSQLVTTPPVREKIAELA
jgi:hypothetical protein